MPDHRQKKLQKHKQKRSGASRSGRDTSQRSALLQHELQRRIIAQTATLPFGPCFVGGGWDDTSRSRLFPAMITRKTSDTELVAAVFLVDLGCLGVRDAFLTRAFPQAELDDFLQKLANSAQRDLVKAEPPMLATIVKRAIDYAESLGFETAEETRALQELLGEPSATELTVPLGRNDMPLYEPQPDEETREVVQKLVKAVGPDGFTVLLPKADASSEV